MKQTKNVFEKIGFRHALNGILAAIKDEYNLKIHLVAAISVVTFGLILKVSLTEWLFLVVAIALVLVAEFFNTAIEKLCNQISTESHPQLGLIKDIAAGAVLVAAILAAVVGLIIFIPNILRLVS